MVKSHFRKLDVEDFLLIYKTYSQPHLEFCIQMQFPHLSKDKVTLERVQRTAQRDWYLSLESSAMKSD